MGTPTSAGDVDYERFGIGYALRRRADPRIAAAVWRALGESRTVVNVGAGAGSYEPEDRYVVAVEPSPTMRAQRPPKRPPAFPAVAEALPFADASVDAAMAMVTVHQWRDKAAGPAELRRVARGPVVVLTFDGEALDRFWLARYLPELSAVEGRRFPTIGALAEILGGRVRVESVPIPADCTDGFVEAYYARPESFLDPDVRQAQSLWGHMPTGVEDRVVRALAAELDSGEWDRRFVRHRRLPTYDGSLRLVTAVPS